MMVAMVVAFIATVIAVWAQDSSQGEVDLRARETFNCLNDGTGGAGRALDLQSGLCSAGKGFSVSGMWGYMLKSCFIVMKVAQIQSHYRPLQRSVPYHHRNLVNVAILLLKQRWTSFTSSAKKVLTGLHRCARGKRVGGQRDVL